MASPASLLSSESEDYGSPCAYAELGRYVMGGIDLDPASSAFWNHHVIKAGTFYDEARNGLMAPLFGKIFHNPPSNRELKMTVRPWWERLVDHYLRGEVECAVWMGFQMGQLQTLQSAPAHPLQFLNLFPSARIDFLRRGSAVAAEQRLKSEHPSATALLLEELREKQIHARRGAGLCVDCGAFLPCARCVSTPPQPAGAPSHANYITLLPTRRSPNETRAMVQRFVDMSKDLQIGGALVRPV